MATVHNPTDWELRCDELGRTISARRFVSCSDAEAELITGTVFVVTLDGDVIETSVKESTETEPEAKTPATRKTARRGSKAAEINEAPDAEAR